MLKQTHNWDSEIIESRLQSVVGQWNTLAYR